jgi:hypothetical protein
MSELPKKRWTVVATLVAEVLSAVAIVALLAATWLPAIISPAGPTAVHR